MTKINALNLVVLSTEFFSSRENLSVSCRASENHSRGHVSLENSQSWFLWLCKVDLRIRYHKAGELEHGSFPWPITPCPAPADSESLGNVWSSSPGLCRIILMIPEVTTDTMAVNLKRPQELFLFFKKLSSEYMRPGRDPRWPMWTPPLPLGTLESPPCPTELNSIWSSQVFGELQYNQGRFQPTKGFL